MIVAIAILAGGLALLIVGARLLVDGAAALAGRLGVHPAAVGLTVVAFGTSTPELLVNLTASANGVSQIAFGNVVGSNLFNTGMILGLSALLSPLTIYKRTTRYEIPLALLAVLMALAAGSDYILAAGAPSAIGRAEGIMLLGFFLVFISYTLSLFAEESAADVPTGPGWPILGSVAATAAGLGMLYFGGEFTVDSAVTIAGRLGVSNRLIALTVVSMGTSLPELVTSLVALGRGQNDLAVSNVVGSNIFNLFFILGVSATITPVDVGSRGLLDLMMLLLLSLLVVLAVFVGPGRRIDRWEGALLLLGYGGYLGYLLSDVI